MRKSIVRIGKLALKSDPSPAVSTHYVRLPTIISDAGERARVKFIEFFTANIRNRNTRRAYHRAVWQLCRWCEKRRIGLHDLNPVIVAAYIEELSQRRSRPTVKQSLAAIRMLCDYLVLGHVLDMNPAASVRGPKHVVKKGKTPVLTVEETRQLFGAIDTQSIVGLRDRALISVMVFSFARIGAVIKMNVEDYLQTGKRSFFRLHEKGGKFHQVPGHHKAVEFIDAYIGVAGIAGDKKGPLFRTLDRRGVLTERRMDANDALRMVKKYALKAGLTDRICNHSFRATGITEFLRSGGSLERAAVIAAHESTRTTQLYNRIDDEVSLDEIERIVI